MDGPQAHGPAHLPRRRQTFRLGRTPIGRIGILLVSNFTVAAATRQGRRPSFDAAADPQAGHGEFDALVEAVRASGVAVATGEFGADMRVELVNDGPVTVILDSEE